MVGRGGARPKCMLGIYGKHLAVERCKCADYKKVAESTDINAFQSVVLFLANAVAYCQCDAA